MIPSSSYSLLFIAASYILHPQYVVGTPLAARQAPDCMHPGNLGGIDPSCWDTLGMTQYTKDWVADPKNACGNIPFAACFLGKHGLSNSNCDGIKDGVCINPSTQGLSAQDWYIAYNIFTINQVFSSLYKAVGNANTLASESVGAIVALLDPVKPPNLLISDLTTALGIGLSLIPGPEGKLAKLILSTAQGLPKVINALFPTGTTDSRIDQWSTISDQVATVVNNYQHAVAGVIPTVLEDANNFLAYASTGSFSVASADLPDLSAESDALLAGLRTFIVGKALDANNFHLDRAIDTDISELQRNSSDALSYDTGCGNGYDGAGICGSFWFDSAAKVTYSLNNYNSMGSSTHDILETLFTKYTSGDLLFGGAARCAAQGGPKDSLATTAIQPDGQVVIDCLSSAQLCTWDVNSIEADHEFTDCPSQPGYVVDGCTGDCGSSDGSSNANVPNGYVGGYLQFSNPTTCVCNT